MKQKRIMAINDISCFGKCSLTVALPVLSACGIETCPVPTAILSTHTGGFSDYHFKDLSEHILPVTKHWSNLNLHFDAIYSGYLGSVSQIKDVKDIIDNFSSSDTKIIVDPVMGDSGKLYAGFNQNFVTQMILLCEKAHVITPNITEACFLTDTKYKEAPLTKEYVDLLINKLKNICAGSIILTGVSFDENKMGAAVYDGVKTEYIFNERINEVYHGTGDVFASSFIGSFISGKTITQSAKIAVDFVIDAIKATKELDGDVHYGVNFEKCIPKLIEYIGEL